jgi:hypothetical protein
LDLEIDTVDRHDVLAKTFGDAAQADRDLTICHGTQLLSITTVCSSVESSMMPYPRPISAPVLQVRRAGAY